jgi:alanyl-tRNA synthetase
MGLNDIREKFLSFFESKNHLRLASSSLIPQNDKSLLLINSGMAPLKDYFTGAQTPPSNRVTTCQKCIRTPDIERVGITSRHGTFFEMLGNFSFGDYFKKDATAWAWEFVTKVMELPVDRIWISIYLDDDEAFEIWTKNVGVAADHIVRLGKEDNFWEHGIGPCGPCSELHFDRGEEYGCGSENCGVGCDCDRFVEFWNLVFTQFNKTESGEYLPLDNPNIDTGMGLERMACIMQGVDNLFEVDTIKNIMSAIATKAKVEYKKDEKTDISLRIITDHIRSTVFMIGDGVTPSNEGRGYVLRRLLRRAARHGWLLGIKDAFLHDIAEVVIEQNLISYPELNEKKAYILSVLKLEENRFLTTIEQGMQILNTFISQISQNEIKTLNGDDAFKLYDTYGFPLDLTKEILSEKGIDVDEETFNIKMQQQRELARNARVDESSWDNANDDYEKQVAPAEKSEANARAHSATHLLHAALRKVLGEHVLQKGSYVGDDVLHFDFPHFELITPEQIDKVQSIVNENIMKALPVDISEMPIDEAKAKGAMALFSEKYGDTVRVVDMSGVSVELCSGRHVNNTGQIGLFKILSESGVAAGVRRIEAVTGYEILNYINVQNSKFDAEIDRFKTEIKQKNSEIKKLKSSAFSNDNDAATTKTIGDITASVLQIDTTDIEILRNAADALKSKAESAIALVIGVEDGSAKFVVSATPSAIENGVNAGEIVKHLSGIIGGRGGGKPNFAQAGGADLSRISDLSDEFFTMLN